MSGKCLVREMTRLGNDPSGKRPIMETTRWGNILSGKRLVSHYQYCHFYIYKVAASVCVSVFRISQKCADRFPWNFSRFIWVIGRRERIKKFRPLMCKNWENGAKWPISRKSPRVMRCNAVRFHAHACAQTFISSQSRAGLGAWPVAFDGGPYQTLLYSWLQFSGPTSRPAFGRVNASNQ